MSQPNPPESPITGPCGTAVQLDIPQDAPRTHATVAHWLLTAPIYHPTWSQYVMYCVRLTYDPDPDLPPAKLQFQGATHELGVVALNPEHGPYDEAKMAGYTRAGGGLPFLTPVNHADQYIATDDEMRQMCAWAAWGVVAGVMNPETIDAPERIRQEWLASMTKTLAHIRGEVHAP
jgi:hypothetical protein